MTKAKYLIWCILNLICALLTILFSISTLELFFETKDFRFLTILPVFALAIKGVSTNIEKTKNHMEWIRKVEESMKAKSENEPEEGLFGEE